MAQKSLVGVDVLNAYRKRAVESRNIATTTSSSGHGRGGLTLTKRAAKEVEPFETERVMESSMSSLALLGGTCNLFGGCA